MQLSLDRKAFIDILSEGHNDIGAVLQPPPEGIWGMPLEILQTLPGYGRDVKENREEAQALMRSLAMGPTTGSRPPCRRATSHGTAIPRRF